MRILGIETSCDETAAAVVEDGRTLVSSAVATQIIFHRPFSGVVPELASRAHVLQVNAVIDEALKKASRKGRPSVDAIAVTVGPGLVGALLVGRMTAETLGWVYKLPVYGVNHIEGHLLSPLLEDPSIKPPFLGLVVSGGHTELIHAAGWGDYRLIGKTRDDAAGEAFDKVARMLGLGYPGGPAVDRMARKGRPERAPFPRSWLPGTWDFSFSGLKTSVLYKLREKSRWSLSEKQDISAGFQESVVDVLVQKTFAAAKTLKLPTIVVGGGVAANSRLRQRLHEEAREAGVRLFAASPAFCTDNAAMIASAAYFKLQKKGALRPGNLRIEPQMHLPPLGKKIPGFTAPPTPPQRKQKQLAK